MDYNDYLRHCMNCGHSCSMDNVKYCSFKSIIHPTKLCDLTSCPKKKVTDKEEIEITEFSSSFFFNHSEIERDIEVAYRICIDLQEKGILKTSISKTKANEFYVQYTIRIPKNNSAAK